MIRQPLAWLLTGLLAAQPPVLKHAESKAVTQDVVADPAVEAVIAPLRKEIEATFGQVLAQSPKGLFRGRRGEENLLGYWVADAMRARAEALLGQPVKFAITNQGGLRSNLRPGAIKVGDIFEVMPFENELVVVEFTGAEIVQIVKEAIYRRGGEPMSGVRAVVNGVPELPQFMITWADGKEIDPKEVVRVATSDYLAGAGDGVSTLRKGRNLKTTGLVLRQILLDLAEAEGKAGRELAPPAPGRYRIQPEMMKAFMDKKVGGA